MLVINNIISIPVHEKTEVVIDQIINYRYFCPNFGIVLHISKGFDFEHSFHTEKEFMFILSTFDNVFVNPNRLDTLFADIVHTHIANFEYISKLVDFEYFSLGASNDLFVRSMPNINEWEVNFNEGVFETAKAYMWYKHGKNDEYLKRLVDYLGGANEDVILSQIEGTYFKKEIFGQIVETINKVYNYREVLQNKRIIYPREEIYYPTVAHLINKNFKNRKIPYSLLTWGNPGCLVGEKDIADIIAGSKEGKYNVKRITRNINHFMRFYIANNIGHYRNETFDKIRVKFGKMSRKLFNLVSGRRRIFVGRAEDESNIRENFKLKTIETFLSFKISDSSIIVDDIISTMNNNRDALFVICAEFYPLLLNLLLQQGFRENVDFIDGTLLMD